MFLLCAWALAGDADFLAWQAAFPENPPGSTGADGYRYAADVWAEVAAATRAHPGVIEAEVIGQSVKERPIWAFHIQDPATEPVSSVLVFANIHALEWIGTEVALDALREWTALPPPGVRITVIPVLNPDGRARAEADLLAGENRYSRGNQRKVDLNRDFAVNAEARAIWRHVIPGRYGHSKVPLSQPESQALDRLAARERYDRAVSLHAFGGFLYYPWSGRWARPDDWDALHDLGRRMEQAQADHAYRTRQLGRWGFFFRAQGSEIDHLYGRYGTQAFLIELTHSGLRFDRPSEWKTYFRWYNPEDPSEHRARGVAALRAVITSP